MKTKVYKPLTIKKCREILGKGAENLSDAEIAEIAKIRSSLTRKSEKLFK